MTNAERKELNKIALLTKAIEEVQDTYELIELATEIRNRIRRLMQWEES